MATEKDSKVWECRISYTNCGVHTDMVVKTFKSEAAARGWCGRYNAKQGPNGCAYVKENAA